jgi:ATP-dependent RNA helicase HelY
VLVAAPTGAGKTVVGEYACHRAIETPGKRCFYTTPIKALSNQKFRDLQARYGEDRVGLLTGDRSINGDADVVVMTTEVLRNMIYAGAQHLDRLQAVVLDEVHYLADRSRGAVWEEVIVQLPTHTQLVSLSATVSNAEEFGAWLDEVRDGCDIIVSEHRPVPLRHHYFVNDRVYPTFRTSQQGTQSKERREAAAQARGGVPNPDVVMLERNARATSRVSKRGRHQRRGPRLRWPDRPTTIAELRDRSWLPAIVFVFSRNGCDKAVDEMTRVGARLTTAEERDEIAVIADTVLADIPDEDLRVLGRDRFVAALGDGIAAHHAGMVPAFKEVVEACFQRGLLKVVFATETLALGINMPARTVVIERLEKWNGETHELLTAGQYTQLTGRAGRRGIDDIGQAVVLYQRDIDFTTVAGLVGRRTYPLESSFTPSYNMAVNMLRQHSLEDVRKLLEQSFAQFQADRSVGTLHQALQEAEAGLEGYDRNLECERGDWAEYWGMRHDLTRLEKAEAKERRRRVRSGVEEGLAELQPGDVVHVQGLGQRGLGAVVGLTSTRKGAPLAEVVTDNRALTRLGTRELDEAPQVIDRVRLPNRGNPRSTEYRKAIGVLLKAVSIPRALDDEDGTPRADGGPSTQVEQLRDDLRTHPCHHCEDRPDHERWQRRVDTVTAESRQLRDRIASRTGTLVRTLDKVLTVLEGLGYVDARPHPTDAGLLLAGIYSEVDLLVAEALREGLFDDLSAPELAAMAAVLVYESRNDDPAQRIHLPTRALDDIVDDLDGLAAELRDRERVAGLPQLRELDAGFASAAYRWASGRSLDDSMGDLQLTGGDFVRVVRMIADLVGQLRAIGDPELAATADHALSMLRRGIVDA